MSTENIVTKIKLAFGVLSDPIVKQLKTQGFKFNPTDVRVFQKEVEAINQLRFGSNLLTDSMVNTLFQKLHKKVCQHVAKENGLVLNPK